MRYILLLCAVFAAVGFVDAQSPTPMQTIIEEVRKQFAPDGRVAIFQVEATAEGVLSGKTNLPAVKSALLQKLGAASIAITDQIQTFPSEVLGEQVFGVVTVSVANMRSQPRDAAELATQALLGMPLKVLDKDRGWYLVQTPDGYISWVDWGGFQRMNRVEFEAWEKSPKVIVLAPYVFSYEAPSATAQTVSDLVAGNVLKLVHEQSSFYEVAYPDGRKAFVSKSEAQPYSDWLSTLTPTEEKLVDTAKRMMGLPYLWGGTSYKGVDCSGFTKTIYYLNGWTIPRDASQQVHTGELIDTSEGFGNLRRGDLLFFGTPATSQAAEKITHVGMWLSNNEFIHASGKVRVSSMDSKAPNYDEFEKNRFIRAKRLLGNWEGTQSLRGDLN